MLKRIALFFLLTAYAQGGFAGWEMHLAFKPVNSSYGNFQAKITSWDAQDSMPNPLYGCKLSDDRCSLYFAYNNVGFDYGIYFPEIRTSKTMGELGSYFISRGFLNKLYSSRQLSPVSPVCFSFGYMFTDPVSGVGGYARLPGGIQCIAPEVVPNVCDFREKMLELDHGKLRAEVINGNTATAQLTVACTYDFNVRIMSSDRSGTIYFNDKKQFRSDLKVNGVDLGTGLLLKAKPAGTSLTVTSTLNGYDGSVGEFQGSKSIIISLP
ncbi:TPA: PapG chaperone-binding domain-containing protein [Serratia marcescens]